MATLSSGEGQAASESQNQREMRACVPIPGMGETPGEAQGSRGLLACPHLSHMGLNCCPGSWGGPSTNGRSPQAPQGTTPKCRNREAMRSCHYSLEAYTPGEQQLGPLRFFSQRGREQLKQNRATAERDKALAFRGPKTLDIGGDAARMASRASASPSGPQGPADLSLGQSTCLSGGVVPAATTSGRKSGCRPRLAPEGPSVT